MVMMSGSWKLVFGFRLLYNLKRVAGGGLGNWPIANLDRSCSPCPSPSVDPVHGMYVLRLI